MFGINKKKEARNNCRGGMRKDMEKASIINASGKIKVLGGGCAKCHDLKANTEAALQEMGLNMNVELITDYAVISAYGVMSTPALVVNEKVVSCGKILKSGEIVRILREAGL